MDDILNANGSPITIWSKREEVTPSASILDGYTDNLVGAFAPALLVPDYTGACMRVRRSGDNAEQDIGFDGIDLDRAAIASFCSPGDGFVVTWYNQDGSGNHLSQGTNSAQPKIYDASTGVELDNAVETLRFDGTDDKFPIDTSNYDIGSLSSFLVGRMRTGTGVMLGLSASVNDKRWYAPYADGTNFNYGYAASTTAIQGAQNANQNLHTMIAGATLGVAQAWTNGTSQGTASLASGMNASQSSVGNLALTFFSAANISAVIIYSADKSADRAAIETAINDYFNIY